MVAEVGEVHHREFPRAILVNRERNEAGRELPDGLGSRICFATKYQVVDQRCAAVSPIMAAIPKIVAIGRGARTAGSTGQLSCKPNGVCAP